MINKQIILGSGSPRRAQILQEVGIDIEVIKKDIEENYPHTLDASDVAPYLAELKAKAYIEESYQKVVLTADTVVIKSNKILGKPNNKAEAIDMLTSLSDSYHDVVTGCCFVNKGKLDVFKSTTSVCFHPLTQEQIEYYVTNYHPFDKAGAYGIQEWIGYIGVKEIKGSYANVVGLPIDLVMQRVYKYS